MEDVTIERVLREIESKTEFKILYNDNQVDYKKKVSVNFKKERLSIILDKLFLKTPVVYEVLDKQIVLVLDSNKNKQTIAKKAIEQQTVSGIVTDEASLPIPGANIIVKGTTNGVVTDFDGNYSISVSSEDVLSVSYIGYATKKVTVGNQTTINIQLQPDVEQLDDIVVIGYGTSKKSDLTGAVSQVSAKSFEDQPVTRVEEALQGRASGVTVAKGGAPGAGYKVRIRGVNSVTGNNDPLVVVDGVFGGDLRTLNPNDIQSIEVLKDASALAIYGSRGSNGVILVSTKKGSGKAKVTLDHFVTVSELAKEIPTISSAEFARAKNASLIAGGSPARYSNSQIAALQNNPYDYQDMLFQTGIGNNTQLSVSGGDDKIRYFASGNYTNQQGTVITTKYERFSLRSNVSAKITDKLNIGLNMYGSRETQINNPDNFNRFKGSVILKALTWDPTLPVQDENGAYLTRANIANNGFNPIATLIRSNRERSADRFDANIDLGYKFTDNFKYQLIVGVGTINQNVESFIREDNASDANANHTTIDFSNGRTTNHQVSNILNWNKSFDKHNLDVTGVYEFQGSRFLNNGYLTAGTNTLNFYTSDNEDLSREDFSNGGSQSAITSYLGRVQYNFDNSLYLTGSIRVDESSRFSKENRTGYFPSAALAYSFNKLKFIEDNNVLNNLKIRAGWGQVGNQNINASARFDRTSPDGRTVFDGENVLVGLVDSQEGNPDLTWETTSQLNAGLDVGFLNGRINTSLDYFHKTTEDLLLRTVLPGTTINQFQNVGEVVNKGIDFSLSGSIIENDNFTWDATFTLSHIDNEVTKLTEGRDQILGSVNSIDGTDNPLNVIRKGESLGAFLGATYLGTWKTGETFPAGVQAGDAKYVVDEDGNNVLGVIGNGMPTLTWGFNTTFTYKNWLLNAFVNAATGFDVYNQLAGAINGGTGDYRDDLSLINAGQWTPQNQTESPRRNAPNNLLSSRYIEDGSFIRLSNLKIGYTFDDLVKGINSLQVYASGQNLFLITDYSGYDPEVSSTPVNSDLNNTDAGVGIDLGAYPNPRSFTLGVKIDF